MIHDRKAKSVTSPFLFYWRYEPDKLLKAIYEVPAVDKTIIFCFYAMFEMIIIRFKTVLYYSGFFGQDHVIKWAGVINKDNILTGNQFIS
jgi:hypothetical protein